MNTTNDKNDIRFEAENEDKRKERLYVSLLQFSKNFLYVNVSRIKERKKKKNLLVVDVVRSVRANIAWRKNKANVRGHEREFS